MEFTVNGEKRQVDTDPRRKLLDVLREDLGLTGTKYGCGEGDCRACTVLIDGKPTSSCQTPISRVENRRVQTIEGLASAGELHPVQRAFVEAEAMQCGYCVPGMILTAVALLRDSPDPNRDSIVEAMNGNICRCAGYNRILAAVEAAAGKKAED